MREFRKNLLFLALAVLVIGFGIATWRHAHNIQGEAVKGYVIRNFEGRAIVPKDDLSIGVITPFSGRYRFVGEESVRGFELAKEMLAAEGKTVHFVYKDSECDPIMAERRADELMKEGVSYIIGADCYGTDPMVVDGVTVNLNPSREAGNPLSFSLASPLADEARALFSRLKRQPDTLAIIYVDDPFGRDYLAAIKETSTGRVKSSYAYGLSQEAFDGIAAKVAARDTETVFIVAEKLETVEAVLIALNRAGYANTAYTNIPVTQSSLDSLGIEKEAFEGLTFISDIDPISSRTTATSFYTALNNEYGVEPTSAAANAYDSAILLARLDEKHQGDTTSVGDAMHTILNHEGVTGFLTLNANSVTRSYYVRTVRDGKVVED